MKIFVSHASRDNDIATAVEALLHDAKLGETFLDCNPETGLVGGPAFDQQLAERLGEAGVVVLLVSESWLSSSWCLAEMRAALLLRKEVIPFRLGDVALEQLPSELAVRQIPTITDVANDATLVRAVREAVKRASQSSGTDAIGQSIDAYIRGLEEYCKSGAHRLEALATHDGEEFFIPTEASPTTIKEVADSLELGRPVEPAKVQDAPTLMADAIEAGAALVVYGRAGTGKSTLLRRFASMCWRQPEQLGLRERFLPILVRLKNLAAAKGETFDARIKHAFAESNEFALERPISDDLLTAWPKSTGTKLLFLFDGLDEVPGQHRTNLLIFLSRLKSSFPDNPIIITTRDAELLRGTEFADPQRARCVALRALSQETAATMAVALLGAEAVELFVRERQRARSFAFDTPLAVRMAASLYRREGRLPNSPADLYDRFAHFVVAERQGLVGIPEVLGNEEGVFHVLGSLALMQFDIRQDAPQSVEECIHRALCQLRPDLSSTYVKGALNDVAAWLRHRSGILSSLRPIVWAHESFREFLAGRFLAQLYSATDPVTLSLLDRHREPPIRGILLFAYAFWAKSAGQPNAPPRTQLIASAYSRLMKREPEKRGRGRGSFLARLLPSANKELALGPSPGPQTVLFLAELLAETRPGPSPIIDQVIGLLADAHADFVGYFDVPRYRCRGDDIVTACLRRWCDDDVLRMALQPLAERYLAHLQMFHIVKNGLVHFLILCGRERDVATAILHEKVLKFPGDLSSAMRGAIAAQGSRSPLALSIARGVYGGRFTEILPQEPTDQPGAEHALDEDRTSANVHEHETWLSAYGRRPSPEDGAYVRAAIVLDGAGFQDEVLSLIGSSACSVVRFSNCIGYGETGLGLIEACANHNDLAPVKRSFAIRTLIARDPSRMDPDAAVNVLAEAEQQRGHEIWAAETKRSYCETLTRYSDMLRSCAILVERKPEDSNAWIELARACYHLGESEDAKRAIEFGLQAGASKPFAHYLRGLVLMQENNNFAAVEAFNEAAGQGNDELRLWEQRLSAKWSAGWHASLLEDVQYLWANWAETPFVRHWYGIALACDCEHEKALEVFAASADEYGPVLTLYYRAQALIHTGRFEDARQVIDEYAAHNEHWGRMLSALLRVARDEPLPNEIGLWVDQAKDLALGIEDMEAYFWMRSALDDQEGAATWLKVMEAMPGSGERINMMKVDFFGLLSPLAKPWCLPLIDDSLSRAGLPAPPRAGLEAYRAQRAVAPVKKVLPTLRKPLIEIMQCRLGFIEGLEHEQVLAQSLMNKHAKGPAVVIIRLGLTDYAFMLCNFKLSAADSNDVKYASRWKNFLSWEGKCPLRDIIVQPHGVKQVIANDQTMLDEAKVALSRLKSLSYFHENVVPDFGGHPVTYER